MLVRTPITDDALRAIARPSGAVLARADAADLVATRQVSKKRPRTYTDYRELLKAKELHGRWTVATAG